MFGFFSWVRAQVKNAILSGINDAIEEANQGDGAAVATVQLRLTAATVAPAVALATSETEAIPDAAAARRKKQA